MKLSIIIPVYQAEKTLERCVDSILKQSFRDYEVVLVNDASSDNSAAICKKLTERDKRVRVIHKKQNVGLSEARNTALRKVHGDYVTFVDADDFIGNDTLHELMTLLRVHPDYDILEYPVYEHYGSPRQHKLLLHSHVYTDMCDYWLRGMAYRHCYAWNKIYRRSLFTEVEFPVGKVFEDVHTLPLLLEKAHCVATTELGLYYYCYNPNGITTKATGKELENLLEGHLNYLAANQEKLDTHSEGFAKYYAHILNIQLDVCETTSQKPVIPIIDVQPLTLKLRLLKLLGINQLITCNKFIHKVYRRSR